MHASKRRKSTWSRLGGLIHDRIYVRGTTRDAIIRDFHRLYYDSWHHLDHKTIEANWLGHKALKCPLDLWVYQEILFETQPDLVIETGTRGGGSALFMAGVLSLIGGAGRLITIDTKPDEGRPEHDRITYLRGSSTSEEVIAQVREKVADSESVLVCLDSDHSCQHVRTELELYSDFVTMNSYLIVEDTNVNGNPVYPDHGPGPMEAVESFLETDRRFETDRSRERFLLSMNPSGYLKRVR